MQLACNGTNWLTGGYMKGDEDGFSNLDLAGRATAGIVMQKRLVTYGLLVSLVASSWAILLGMGIRAAKTFSLGEFGPGAALLEGLPDIDLPPFLETFFQLCLNPSVAAAATVPQAIALVAMWFLMALAMMLPSAAPMIRTYCEIADTARREQKPVVHPLVLVAGYLTVWLVAAFVFAAGSLVLQRVSANAGSSLVGGSMLAGGVALFGAGLYQFSGLKDACLKKCQNPFSVLFSRWSARPVTVYRLGIEQGIWCLGCCWALMLVMFAVGLANVFWMALLAVFTTVEKQTVNHVTTYLAGAILLVWALGLFLIWILQTRGTL